MRRGALLLLGLFVMPLVIAAPAEAQTTASQTAPLTRPRRAIKAPPPETRPLPAPSLRNASPQARTAGSQPDPTRQPPISADPQPSPPSVTSGPLRSAELPALTAALQPLRPLPPSKIAERLEEAQRLLKSRPHRTIMPMTPPASAARPTLGTSSRPETTGMTNPPAAAKAQAAGAMSGATNMTASPVGASNTFPSASMSSVLSVDFVTVAALDPDTSKMHLLTLPKTIFLRKGSEAPVTTSLGSFVRIRIVRANGVNTAVTIFDATGHQYIPLVVEYPIEHKGVLREVAYYTSAHPALLSSDLVKSGQYYVRTMIDLAAKRLKERGVSIAPNILEVAERLCVVEHIDHDRFYLENRIVLFDEIYSLYALNQLDTYRYSVSFAGAGGMVQMIPATYHMERAHHPGVGLNPDFVPAMRNHGNALEAMLLYMQDTWNDLQSRPDVMHALATGIATPTDLMAAGYNSNPARLALYIRRGGSDWRSLIPRETQTYLQIYHSLDSLIPMKTPAAPQFPRQVSAD